MPLTNSQQRAIAHDGQNLQLVACAASGKTEVVARRVVHLLQPNHEESLTPGNIIAFTFTEKAAAELKERILTRTRQALGEINGLAEMFVGTIHAFCLDLLKSEVWRFEKVKRSEGSPGPTWRFYSAASRRTPNQSPPRYTLLASRSWSPV
jgi:DNA helicase-2/ATP-dependent DNA helicase PcrA